MSRTVFRRSRRSRTTSGRDAHAYYRARCHRPDRPLRDRSSLGQWAPSRRARPRRLCATGPAGPVGRARRRTRSRRLQRCPRRVRRGHLNARGRHVAQRDGRLLPGHRKCFGRAPCANSTNDPGRRGVGGSSRLLGGSPPHDATVRPAGPASASPSRLPGRVDGLSASRHPCDADRAIGTPPIPTHSLMRATAHSAQSTRTQE